MFSGIIETVGTVAQVRDRGTTRVLRLEAPEIAPQLGMGDSVSVDGACLTARDLDSTGFTVDVIGTTLSRTVAGTYRPGSPVNLERALALGGRLDGHLVQGHVDGLGHLKSVREDGEYWLLDFHVPEEVARFTILHGSVAINGVSLTVNALPAADQLQVGIIPFTWDHTNLGRLRPGDPVNLEADLIGKYVGKLLAGQLQGGGLSLDTLKGMGYGPSQ